MSFPWDEWDGDLRRLEADGLSCGEMARVLSAKAGHPLSSNAVVGRLHRTGVWGKGSKRPPRPATPNGNVVAKRVRAPRSSAPAMSATRAAVPLCASAMVRRVAVIREEAAAGFAATVANTEDGDIPPSQRVTLMGLREGVCRWPVGEPGAPDFFFCGGRADDGHVYCQHHHVRARG